MFKYTQLKDKLSITILLDCFWVYNLIFLAHAHHYKVAVQDENCPRDGQVTFVVVLTLFISIMNLVFPVLYATVFIFNYLSTKNYILLLYLKEKFFRGRIPFVWLFYDDHVLMPSTFVAILSFMDITRLLGKIITSIALLVQLSQLALFTLVDNCVSIYFLGWGLWISEVFSIFSLAIQYRSADQTTTTTNLIPAQNK